MSLFDLLLTGSGAVYTAAILWLLAGLRRGRAPTSPRSISTSIIVAARNEAGSIESCLQALKRQDYEGAMEVVVIDDRSRDDTAARVLEQAREWPRLKLVRAREKGPFRCPKKSALARGIDASGGELLLFTDADCRPPPGWVRSTAAHFADDVGLVAGYACFRPGKSARLGLLALDNLAVAALSAGSVGMGHVLACTGRNLAYRRQVYEEVGGFESIGHLIGGDDVYFARLVARRSGWRLVYNRAAEAAVPCNPGSGGWADLMQQKLRHASKAGHYRGFALVLAAVVYLFHLLLLAGAARMALQWSWDALLLSVWGVRFLVDFILLWSFAPVRERGLIAYLPLLELLYIPYVLVFTVLGRLGWFRWKS